MQIQKAIQMLGFKAKDKVTGREGVITSVSFDLYGCVQLLLTPLVQADGKQAETNWYDEKRLRVLDKRKRVMPVPDFVHVPGPTAKPTK